MAADSLRRMADEFIEMESIREFITRPPRPAAKDSASADDDDSA
jgi:uncharacterized LabA/DUF88 family protein